MAKDVIRTLTVRGKDENLDAVAAKVRKVGQEAKAAGEGVAKLGADTERAVPRLGNLDRQLANLDKRLAGAPRAFADFERNSRLLQRGLDAGKLSAQDFSRQMAELQTQLQKSIAPKLGVDVDQSGLRHLINGQVELDAATRRTIMTVVQQQEQIERSMQAAANDVVAFGAELDRLRSKYNPIYAASKKYEAELNELNQAHQIGAINAREHGAALEVLNARYQQTATGTTVVAESTGLARMQAQNLGYQIQDIGTMLAMGQNPFMLLAQQLPQVTQHGGQLNGVMGALKSTLGNLFSPLGLLTTGFVLAGSAAISYFTSAADEGDEAADALKEQESLILRVADRWGDAIPALRAYANEMERAADAAELLSGVLETVNHAWEQARATLPDVRAEIGGIVQELIRANGNSPAIYSLRDAFNEADRAAQDLRQAIQDNTQSASDYERVTAALAALMANDAVAGSDALRIAIDNLFRSYGRAADEAVRLNQETQRALATEAAREANRSRFDGTGQRLSPGSSPLRDDEFNSRFGWGEVFDLPDDTAKKLREAERAAERLARAYDRLFTSAQGQIDQMRLEIDLVGQYGAEADALRYRFELLQQAKEAGIELGAEEIQRIDELTEAYRRLAGELAAAQAMSDIMFERSLIGLSDGDQQIVSALRQWGLDANTAQGQFVAGQLRVNQVMQESQDEIDKMGQIGKDAFMSILDLLYETGDIGDKLIGIFANIGKEFAKLGMEKLWKQISGEGLSKFDGLAGGASGASAAAQAATTQRIESSVQRMTETMSVASDDLAGNIRRAAEILGTSAHDLATVISFETGGKFDPNIRGGAGNRHIGLIQFGPEEQRRYGAAIGQTLTDQMDAVIRYLQDRGFKPGMTGAELYATINTGSPRTGHRSDAANGGTWGSANDKWNYQMGGHRANAERILGPQEMRGAVKGGLIDFSQQQQTAADTATAGNATPGGGLLGGNMKGVMAGIGAFAGGLQSGDPLGGAISGGLGMLGAGFGAVGIIGGAVLGLIGGLIGRARQKREELKKAQQELEQQMGAITELIATATGNFMGTFEKTVMQTADEFSKAIAMANKAKNVELVNELEEAQNEFFSRLTDRWERGLDGMVASMEAGLGMDGEFLAGMDAVEKARESLVGFINDFKLFADANGDLASVIKNRKDRFKNESEEIYRFAAQHDGGRADAGALVIQNDILEGYRELGDQIADLGVQAYTKTGGMLYDSLDALRTAAEAAGLAIDDMGVVTEAVVDPNEKLTKELEDIQKAAQATALAMISGAEEFTAMEEAVQKINGTVATMKTLLEDLGMSAEDAATAIDLHLNIAMAKLRDAYRDELNASINDLSGFGFLNEIVDAMDRYEERLKDSAVLGLDASLATRELNLALADIVDTADLTQAQIDMLAEAFPLMAGLMETVAGQDAIQMVRDAEAALRSAYEAQRREIEATISRLENFTDRIKEFRDEMRLSASSPLGQRDQMEEALRQFRETAALARGEGDEAIEAQEKLTSVSQSALDEARAYYASSEAYADIWREIDQTLADVESKAGRQLSEAQQQLEALDRQVGALIDINDSVLSVADAIAALAGAQSARDKALQDQINAAKNAGAETRTAEIAALYQSILGRAGSASEIDWWANKTTKSIDTIRADMEWAKLHGAMRYGGVVGAYANGGIVGNGMFDVDSVLARYAGGGMIGLAGGEGILTAPAMRSIGADNLAHMNTYRSLPGNDNSAVVRELQALREDVRGLKAENARLATAMASTGNQTVVLLKQGNDQREEAVTQQKLAGSRP